MFGIRDGNWWVTSKSDPRWDMKGHGTVGGLCLPPDAKKAIEAKEKELGCKHPEDLTYGYMKD